MTTYKEMKSISFDNGNTVYNITDASVGTLSNLTTPDKTNIVSAINSIGNLSYTAKCPAITPINGIATWVITHNMGSLGIVCSLYTKTGVEIVKNTTINSANQITVTFNTSVAVAAEDYTINILANGGVTTISNHAQLDNLDYANSGHTGFMKDDASNLTTDGQKVFDGQWVTLKNRLANNTNYPTTENLTYDLSNILPNDNYNYEVMIMGYTTTGTTVGNQASMEVITDLTNGKSIMLGGATDCVVSGKSVRAGFNCTVPIGIQRYLTMYHQSWVTATFSLWIMSYRRIGTNQ